MAIFALIVRRWKAVKPSFYGTLTASAGVVIGATVLTSSQLPDVSVLHQRIWLGSSLVSAGVLAMAGLAYWFDRQVPVRFSDVAAFAGSFASAVSCVAAGAAQTPPDLGVARALSALAFLGSVTATMVLGHWFLVDPKLDRSAIYSLGVVFIASLPIEVVSLILKPGMLDVSQAPLAGISGYLRLFWYADVLLTVVLGLAVLGALKNRGYPAVMAATGLSYLAILTAFGVDVIAKAMIGGVI